MKQKLTKILTNTKIVIGTTLIVALVVGVTSSIIHNKSKIQRSEIASELTGLKIKNNNLFTKDLTLAFPTGGRIKSVSVKIGDKVKAGDVLASLDSENAVGVVNQAKGAYTAAQTNYDKLINGTSIPEIEIARVSLNNAKNSYNNIVAQQKVLVTNALSAMYNSSLTAIPEINSTSTIISPIVSGTYNGTEEGTYTITVYGNYFSFSGIENGSGSIGTVAVPLGTKGLSLQFPSNFTSGINNTWTVSIPNIQSATYLTYQNNYQTVLQNQTQATTTAQGLVDVAQAVLDQKITGARSEDFKIAKAQVESTLGTLQIAQSIYNNIIITAPVNGIITNVSITAGQIATPNTPAIELLSQ